MNSRNAGIDLLRIIAMFYVVILHSLGSGEGMTAAVMGSTQYKCAWLLETWAYGAVDIFALISGYVYTAGRKYRRLFSSLIEIWLQVVFYSVLIAILLSRIFPGDVGRDEIITAFFPITQRTYWYFTGYAGMVCLVPVMSAGIEHLKEGHGKKMLIVLFAAFSVVETFAKESVMNNGYSFIWLCILFIMGAIIRKCDIGRSWPSYRIAAAIILLNIIAWAWKIYGIDGEFLLTTIGDTLTVSYCSPMIVMSSALYLILFSRIGNRGGLFGKIVGFFAPGAFAVYIINANPCFDEHYISGMFSHMAEGSTALLILAVVAFSLAFLICTMSVDYLRRKLFAILHVRQLADKLVDRCALLR